MRNIRFWIATGVVIVLVIVVWKVIDVRMRPPPPPLTPEAASHP